MEMNEKGFIFSLDATLGLIVVAIVIAGVAQIGNPYTQSQFSSMKLERQANDTLRVLSLSGTLENALREIEESNLEKAEQILRDNLNEMLSEGIQFKLSVGNRLVVYPTESDEWKEITENLKENIVSEQLSSVPPEENYLRVLTWVPENREQKFVDNIATMRQNWQIEKITEANEDKLRENTIKSDEGGNPYEFYDAVFIPDADITFSTDTVNRLKKFSEHGRLIFGGSTLYLNQNVSSLREHFGITDDIEERDDNTQDGGVTITDMYAWHTDFNFDHPIVRQFVISHRLEYRGDHIYKYGGEVGTEEGQSSGYDISAEVLTSWGDQPESSHLVWNGIIANDPTGGESPQGQNITVYLNMNIAQTAISENTDPYEWLMLAIRSISGGKYEYYYEPVKLLLWRGEGV